MREGKNCWTTSAGWMAAVVKLCSSCKCLHWLFSCLIWFSRLVCFLKNTQKDRLFYQTFDQRYVKTTRQKDEKLKKQKDKKTKKLKTEKRVQYCDVSRVVSHSCNVFLLYETIAVVHVLGLMRHLSLKSRKKKSQLKWNFIFF